MLLLCVLCLLCCCCCCCRRVGRHHKGSSGDMDLSTAGSVHTHTHTHTCTLTPAWDSLLTTVCVLPCFFRMSFENRGFGGSNGVLATKYQPRTSLLNLQHSQGYPSGHDEDLAAFHYNETALDQAMGFPEENGAASQMLPSQLSLANTDLFNKGTLPELSPMAYSLTANYPFPAEDQSLYLNTLPASTLSLRQTTMLGLSLKNEESKSQGSRLSMQGSRLSMQGSRLSMQGSRQGSRPSIHELRPSIHGSRPSIHGSRPSINGSRPSIYSSRTSGLHGSRGASGDLLLGGVAGDLLLRGVAGDSLLGGVAGDSHYEKEHSVEDDILDREQLSLSSDHRLSSPHLLSLSNAGSMEVPTRDSSPLPHPLPSSSADHMLGYGKDFASLTCIVNQTAISPSPEPRGGEGEEEERVSPVHKLSPRRDLTALTSVSVRSGGKAKQATILEEEERTPSKVKENSPKKGRSKAMSRLEKLTSLDYIRQSFRIKKKKVSFQNVKTPENTPPSKKTSKKAPTPEQARAEQARAQQARAQQAREKQARAEQTRAQQARAEQARAEQARVEAEGRAGGGVTLRRPSIQPSDMVFSPTEESFLRAQQGYGETPFMGGGALPMHAAGGHMGAYAQQLSQQPSYYPQQPYYPQLSQQYYPRLSQSYPFPSPYHHMAPPTSEPYHHMAPPTSEPYHHMAPPTSEPYHHMAPPTSELPKGGRDHRYQEVVTPDFSDITTPEHRPLHSPQPHPLGAEFGYGLRPHTPQGQESAESSAEPYRRHTIDTTTSREYGGHQLGVLPESTATGRDYYPAEHYPAEHYPAEHYPLGSLQRRGFARRGSLEQERRGGHPIARRGSLEQEGGPIARRGSLEQEGGPIARRGSLEQEGGPIARRGSLEQEGGPIARRGSLEQEGGPIARRGSLEQEGAGGRYAQRPGLGLEGAYPDSISVDEPRHYSLTHHHHHQPGPNPRQYPPEHRYSDFSESTANSESHFSESMGGTSGKGRVSWSSEVTEYPAAEERAL